MLPSAEASWLRSYPGRETQLNGRREKFIVKKMHGFAGIILVLAFGLHLVGQVKIQRAQPPFKPSLIPTLTEMFFTYIGDYPREAQTDWSGGLQGVAHDDENWYFTSALDSGERGYLMKFPLAYGLTRGVPENATGYGREGAGVRCINKATIPGNPLGSFWHLGDLDFAEGFLFVPVERSDSSVAQVIAVFRASDLRYIGHQSLIASNTRAGWCAVHPIDKHLYVPRSDVMSPEAGILKYPLNLDEIRRASLENRSCHTFLAPPVDEIKIKDECGHPISLGAYNQGGDFSDDGRLLFLNSGQAAAHTGGERAEGITVYETSGWTRVAHSRNGSRLFDYEYHPNAPRWEEPEGLTWWNLDAHPRKSGIPGEIGGQLHVIMIDPYVTPPAHLDYKYYFKHYRVDPMAAVREDLSSFSADRAATIRVGGGEWKIQDGAVEFGGFRSEADATKALRIFRHYRTDSAGYLATRNHPSLRYVLAGGRAPIGPAPGERMLAFDPLGLRLKRGSGGWQVTDESPHSQSGSNHRDILWFPDRDSYDRNGVVEQEARAAIKIIRKYGFNHKCGVGGWPDSALVYFRR